MAAPIVVSTDFSAAAAEAVAVALRLARATGAPLHLLHVIHWPDAGPFEVAGAAPTATREADEERALAEAALARLVADVGEVPVIRVARHGNVPAVTIAAYARSVGAELAVVGRSGQRRGREGLGAVASELIQSAPCDVLLVPEPDGFAPASGGRVLVAVDLSAASAVLLRTGLAAAAALGADGVDLVYVLEPMPHPMRWIDETLLDLLPGIRARADTALRDLVAETVDPATMPDVGLYVERGKAARTIARTAEALGARMLVVGPHAERPVLDSILGSVAEGVARRANCPVWIARQSAALGTDANV